MAGSLLSIDKLLQYLLLTRTAAMCPSLLCQRSQKEGELFSMN